MSAGSPGLVLVGLSDRRRWRGPDGRGVTTAATRLPRQVPDREMAFPRSTGPSRPSCCRRVEPVPPNLLAELLEMPVERSRRLRRAGRGVRGGEPGVRARPHGGRVPLPDPPRPGPVRGAVRHGGDFVTPVLGRLRDPGHHRLPPAGLAGADRRAPRRERRRRGAPAQAARGTSTPSGRRRVPDSPCSTGPPPAFLEKLGLYDLGQLPPVEDLLPGPEAVEELEERLRPGADA